jgi:hypothetical protein
MQNTEYQDKPYVNAMEPGRVGESSVLPDIGCVNKKWIFQRLKPHRKYRTEVVRTFFTTERLERCGISPEQLPSIRDFSMEASHVIVSDLQKFGFL